MAKVPGVKSTGAADAKLAAAVKKANEAKKAASTAAKAAARAKRAAHIAAAKAATAQARAAAAEAKVAAMRPGSARSSGSPPAVSLPPPPDWPTNLSSGPLFDTASIIAQWKDSIDPDDPQQMNLLLDLRKLEATQVWYLAGLISGQANVRIFSLSSLAELVAKLANEVTTFTEGPIQNP